MNFLSFFPLFRFQKRFQKKWFRGEQSEAGFTLIEIIVVMVIIGILVTLGGGSFITSQQKGRDARRKSDLRQIANALELYANDHPTGTNFQYPNHSGGFEIEGCGTSGTPTTCSWGAAFQQTVGSATAATIYMPELPSDPRATAIEYHYEADPDGEWYVLFARLENTEDAAVEKSGGDAPMVYDGIMCGDLGCNYAVASSNIVPTEAAALIVE